MKVLVGREWMLEWSVKARAIRNIEHQMQCASSPVMMVVVRPWRACSPTRTDLSSPTDNKVEKDLQKLSTKGFVIEVFSTNA